MTELKQGDLILVKTNHFVSKLIRFGQRSYGKEASQWNHVAIYVGIDEKGDHRIVEALTKGVEDNPLVKYPADSRKVVETISFNQDVVGADDVMRENAAEFAVSCVGEKYGFLTIFAIAIKTLTKGKIDFNIQGTNICSGLAARSLERMGYNWNPYDPAELTPAYLAKELS